MDLLTGKFLAEGKFGAVYVLKNDPSRVVKIVVETPNYDVDKEVEMLQKVQSDFVTKLWKWEKTNDELHLILEHVKGGNLYHFLGNYSLSNKEIEDFYRQIVLAIRFIHGRQIIHRDIKLENILLTNRRKLKLADFAFATEYHGEPIHDIMGTIPYLSPEMLSKNGYDYSTDVWSSGIVLYEMISGYPPFDAPTEIQTMTMIKKYNYLPVITSPKLQKLLSMVLKKDVKKRWTIQEILYFM